MYQRAACAPAAREAAKPMYCPVVLLLLGVLTAIRLPGLRQLTPDDAPGVDASRLQDWRGAELRTGHTFIAIALARCLVGIPIGVLVLFSRSRSSVLALLIVETVTLLAVCWVASLSASGERQRRALGPVHLSSALPMPGYALALLMVLLSVLTFLWLGARSPWSERRTPARHFEASRRTGRQPGGELLPERLLGIAPHRVFPAPRRWGREHRDRAVRVRSREVAHQSGDRGERGQGAVRAQVPRRARPAPVSPSAVRYCRSSTNAGTVYRLSPGVSLSVFRYNSLHAGTPRALLPG